MSAERVVVVGAGIAGLTSALLLAQRGLQVTVVDAASEPGGKIRRVMVDGAPIDSGPTVFTMKWIFDGILDAVGTRLDRELVTRPLPLLARHFWEEGGELDAGLPAAGELADGALELRGLELELAGDFAALPVGLGAIAHQKLKRRLAGEKRVVLPQVAQPQPGEANDVAGVEFLFAEDDPQEGALAGAVAADEADLAVIGDRGGGVLEEDLVAIPLRGVLNVEENGHRGWRGAR